MSTCHQRTPAFSVAPLAGSVDRNLVGFVGALVAAGSLPSRGAWIEISLIRPFSRQNLVAPLAGSVDRNSRQNLINLDQVKVAPLAGSVDRNLGLHFLHEGVVRRSPRGERG